VDRTVGEILVGNSEIADVIPLTDRSLYVLGKKVGATRLSILDPGKQLLAIVELEVAFDLEGIRSKIKERIPHGDINASSAHGRVLLTGIVSDSVALNTAIAIVQQYAGDQYINSLSVRASQQVMLEVRFVEVSRRAGRDLGFNWATITNNGKFSATTARATNAQPIPFVPGDFLVGTIAAIGFPSGLAPFGTAVLNQIAGGNIDGVIQALEQRGLARRLAEPNLTALSGDTASFLAGGEFPVPIPTSDLQAPAIQFKEFGVSLGFTPTVLADGLINLKIVPEVSELDFATGTSVNGTTVPGLITRRASTTVELRDGQSFAIAGLLSSTYRNELSQLPWIGRVPVLGALFRSTSFQKNETDLVVIITPRLVKPAIPGEKLATPFDKTLPGNDIDVFLEGNQEIRKKFPTPYGHILDVEEGAFVTVVKPYKDPPHESFNPLAK
jgi:pilus assembly protein CpaC